MILQSVTFLLLFESKADINDCWNGIHCRPGDPKRLVYEIRCYF